MTELTSATLTPERTLLIVIDMENEFCKPGGLRYSPRCAADFPGLRRNGSSWQSIDPPQDFPKRFPGRGDFGQLERDVSAMADNFGADLDRLLP